MFCVCCSGHASLSSCPWVLLEDLSSVYTDVEVERKHHTENASWPDGRGENHGQAHELIFIITTIRHMHIHVVI